MTSGIGLFGTFTAYAASFFLQQGAAEEKTREEEILVKLRAIRERLERLEGKCGEDKKGQ